MLAFTLEVIELKDVCHQLFLAVQTQLSIKCVFSDVAFGDGQLGCNLHDLLPAANY